MRMMPLFCLEAEWIQCAKWLPCVVQSRQVSRHKMLGKWMLLSVVDVRFFLFILLAQSLYALLTWKFDKRGLPGGICTG